MLVTQEANHEIALLDGTVGMPMKRDHLVAVLTRAVPRSVQCHDRSATIVAGHPIPADERYSQRGVVGTELVHGCNRAKDLIVSPFTEVRVGNAIAIGKGPAVELPLPDLVQLARGKVVAEQIASVIGGIELAVPRRPVEARAVAQARCIDLLALPLRCVPHDRRAARIAFQAGITGGAHIDVEQPIRAESNRLLGVAA